MAIYLKEIPYLISQSKQIALPKGDIKNAYGSLVFLWSEDISQTIRMINNKTVVKLNDYKQYYYNLDYRGRILGKQYMVKDVKKREEYYEKVKDLTKLNPHPPTLLNKTPNVNTYFEMMTYRDIFESRAYLNSVDQYVKTFWGFYRSIWESPQTSGYNVKTILINTDDLRVGDDLMEGLRKSISTMMYYSLYKHLDLIKDLNIDFVFYSAGAKKVLKINPSLCDDKSYLIFKREVNKMYYNKGNFHDNDTNNEKNELKQNLKTVLYKTYNFLGDEMDTQDTSSDVDEVIEKIVDVEDPKASSSKKKALSDEADTALAEELYNKMINKTLPTKPLSSARDKMMRERQENIQVKGITLDKLKKMNATQRTIPVKDVSGSIKNLNNNMKKVKYPNINKDYIENVMPVDLVNTFGTLNDKSYKMYIRDIQIIDTSDELNYKDTYKVTMEDMNKQRHTITVDIPKFIENKFLYLGGNKKTINKQNFLMPVVKIAPDTVQIVTNYNKMFLKRTSAKSISTVERMLKLTSEKDSVLNLFVVGNNSSINKIYVTTIEYDEYGKLFTSFKNKDVEIFFNQKDAHMYADDKGINLHDEFLFAGIKGKTPIFININTQLTEDNKSLTDIMLETMDEEDQASYQKVRSTKKLMHNTVTIMTQTIPLIMLLLYWEGISKVLNKMKVEFRIEKKGSVNVGSNEALIKFADMYLIYKETMQSSLLLNGLKAIDTSKIMYEDLDKPETYIDYFKKVYGQANILNAISNFYEWIIDNITQEVLENLKLPTDAVSLCIYASDLLADDAFTQENNQSLYRIRSAEIIPAILYNELSRAYLVHKNSMGKKKVSLPKDAVIKQLLALQTVEDYSTLNPVVELEKDRALSAKGFRGTNVDRAYTEAKRSYDETMLGIVSLSTSPDGNVGINRFLTMEPNITSARGFVDIKNNDVDSLKDNNLFSPAELLYPLGNRKDDAIRTAMAGKQSKHVIPVKNATPALITNGADEAIRFHLSSDFCINAEEDGEVIGYNEKNNIYMVKYKSGKTQAIDLKPNIVKNGGGGFYLSNQLTCNLKVGQKIKKDDALAWHKDFFTNDPINGMRMNVGALVKVAIMSSYATYNDSTVITQKLAEECETQMTFAKSVVVGKNSNIYSMKKIGDHVEIGDTLLSFDTSFDDGDLNKLLSTISVDDKKALDEVSMQNIKSKYAGKIIDIKMYSTVELDDMSPSLSKVVKSYYTKINDKKKFISQYDNTPGIVKAGVLLNESSGVVEPNVYGLLKGEYVEDGVLMEFYIEHADLLGVGDKVAYFTALKSVVGEVIPKGYEPFSEFRPEEEVSTLIDPSAIQKRQVPSIEETVGGNKVFVELKRKMLEIYRS